MYQKPKKTTLFTSTFFNFLLGFIVILSLSLGMVFATGYYAKMVAEAKDTAAALLSLIF